MNFIERIFQLISDLLAESRTYRLHKRECANCAKLQLLIENERRERNKLIEALISRTEPQIEEIPSESVEYKPVPSTRSWVAKRYELEEAARQQAREKVVAQ